MERSLAGSRLRAHLRIAETPSRPINPLETAVARSLRRISPQRPQRMIRHPTSEARVGDVGAKAISEKLAEAKPILTTTTLTVSGRTRKR